MEILIWFLGLDLKVQVSLTIFLLIVIALICLIGMLVHAKLTRNRWTDDPYGYMAGMKKGKSY